MTSIYDSDILKILKIKLIYVFGKNLKCAFMFFFSSACDPLLHIPTFDDLHLKGHIKYYMNIFIYIHL